MRYDEKRIDSIREILRGNVLASYQGEHVSDNEWEKGYLEGYRFAIMHALNLISNCEKPDDDFV